MNDLLLKVQALQTADDGALASVVSDLQALIAAAPETPAAVTLVSVVATFSDGSTQRLPVLVMNPVQSA